MTFHQIVHEVNKLSINEQLLLLELLTNLIKQQIPEQAPLEDTTQRVRGMLKPGSGVLPTESELNQDYTDYLIEKYS